MAKFTEYTNIFKEYSSEILGDYLFTLSLINDYHLILENDSYKLSFYSYQHEGGISIQIFDKYSEKNSSFGKLFRALGSPSFITKGQPVFQDKFKKDIYWKFRILQLILDQNNKAIAATEE